MKIAIDKLVLDPDLQPRAELSEATLAEYTDALMNGAELPAIDVFFDGASHFVADGFHRVVVHKRAGRAEIECRVQPGSKRDAILFSCGANAAHGLPRSNADKRRAVETLLRDEEWSRQSDRWIAERCAVSAPTVGKYREELTVRDLQSPTERVGRDGRTIDTTNIGRRTVQEPPGAAASSPSASSAPLACFSSESVEWYTPQVYLDAARDVLGGIDLDPATSPTANAKVGANLFFTKADDGLSREWHGRVWLNPPYGEEAGESMAGTWAAKMIEEYQAGRVRAGMILVNAVPERKWFQQFWDYPICFTDHRIKFYTPTGEPRSPVSGNAFVYLGPDVARFASVFSQFGAVVERVNAK